MGSVIITIAIIFGFVLIAETIKNGFKGIILIMQAEKKSHSEN